MANDDAPRPLPPLTPPPPKSAGAESPRLPPAPSVPTGISAAPSMQVGFSPERAIEEQIGALENWVADVARADKRYVIRFWVLRGLAFVTAAGAAAFGAVGKGPLVIAMGAIAALCIAIDSAWPSTAGRNPLRRAVHDLRELQNTVKLKWDKVRLAHPDQDDKARTVHAMSLLDELQEKREEVGRYMGGAQASPTAARDD